MKKQRFHKNIIFILFLLLTIFLIILIFRFSSENSVESNATSHAFIETTLKLFIEDYQSLPPNVKLNYLNSLNDIIRVFGHFSIFAALGFCSAGSFRFLSLKLSIKQRYGFALIFGFLNAVFDEIHQYFVPGRAFQFFDIIIDSIGLFLGTLIFALILCFINKNIKKKKITP